MVPCNGESDKRVRPPKPRMNSKSSGKNHKRSRGRTKRSRSGGMVTKKSEGSGAFVQMDTKQQPVLKVGTVPCKKCGYLMDEQRIDEHMLRFHGKGSLH
jgi:hypothetical protein